MQLSLLQKSTKTVIMELGAQKMSVDLATMVLFLFVHLYVKFDFFPKIKDIIWT